MSNNEKRSLDSELEALRAQARTLKQERLKWAWRQIKSIGGWLTLAAIIGSAMWDIGRRMLQLVGLR